MDNNEKTILKTIIYSDIFTYPLTAEEIWQYAITRIPIDQKQLFISLQSISLLQKKDNYYFLRGREHLAQSRITRENIAKRKMAIAKRISIIVSLLPTIYFLGISGSLAMSNTQEKDDIDLFIITKKHTLWFTRLYILIVLTILGKRRRRNEKNTKDTVCVNLLIDERALAFPLYMQNIYSAHEIVQVKPLYNRHNTYQKFLSANIWIKQFMPNAIEVGAARYRLVSGKDTKSKKNTIFIALLLCCCATLFNSLAKRFQLWYMKDHHTSEIITDTFVSFYSNTTQKNVLRVYMEKLKLYGI